MVRLGRVVTAIGMLFTIGANFLPPSNNRALGFVIGGVLMTFATVIERKWFFTVLQAVVFIGAVSYFLPLNLITKIIVPLTIGIGFTSYCWWKKWFGDRFLVFGDIGIIMLALGYALGHPVLYLVGGLLLALYSWASYFRGVTLAIFWAILNTIFCIAVVVNMIIY
jgi:hypothetical protein